VACANANAAAESAPRETRESILIAYPYLEEADIDEALRYAACLSEDETIELRR
jgi:uncharacterized protein (DUF433 family)